jgi:hypothetical protein
MAATGHGALDRRTVAQIANDALDIEIRDTAAAPDQRSDTMPALA